MVCVDGYAGPEAARTEKAHGVVPGFCKRSSLGILSPEFCPPPAPCQVQEAERSPEKESIERPKGFSRFGRFRDPDPLRCYTSTLLLYLKTRWRPRRRPPKTSSKQETHKSSSMESGVVTDPANYPQLSFEHGLFEAVSAVSTTSILSGVTLLLFTISKNTVEAAGAAS